jgi:hypothetical protein
MSCLDFLINCLNGFSTFIVIFVKSRLMSVLSSQRGSFKK